MCGVLFYTHIHLSLLCVQIETHVEGQRVRYFQDDDRMGLKEMVRREKMSTAQDQNALYSRMAAKVRSEKQNLLQHSSVIKCVTTAEMLSAVSSDAQQHVDNSNKTLIYRQSTLFSYP